MSYKSVSNDSIVNDFMAHLDTFELNLTNGGIEAFQKREKLRSIAVSLKTCMDRIIFAFPIDSFQMLSVLTYRMMMRPKIYSELNMLSLSESLNLFGGGKAISAIPYGILRARQGHLPQFDQNWFTVVNGNGTIQVFLESIAKNSILQYANTIEDDVYDGIALYRQFKNLTVLSSEDDIVTVAFQGLPISLDLTGDNVQTVNVVADPSFVNVTNREKIRSFIDVTCGKRQFALSSNIKVDGALRDFLNSVMAALNSFCDAGFSHLTIPKQFHKFRLFIDSFDSGQTWNITSFQIRSV